MKVKPALWAVASLTFAVNVFLCFNACDSKQPRNPSSPDELRLPILATSALQSLDPIRSVELIQFNLDYQIFEGLVGIDREGKIVPGLAERWEASADWTSWTFHLRDSTFANDPCFSSGKGRKVSVEDVIYSLERGMNPRAGSLNSWALSTVVVGGEAFAKGETHDVPGMERIDDKSVRIRLVAPDRNFLSRLTVLSTFIVPEEAVKQYGTDFGRRPVGSGPFRLVEWKEGERLVLERNETFGVGTGWQPQPAKIARASFTFFRSEAQVNAAFDRDDIDIRDAGGADLARFNGADALTELRRLYPAAQVFRPGWVCNVHLLAPMMGGKFAFGNSSAMRRWLSREFPRQDLASSALRGLGDPQLSVFPPEELLVNLSGARVPKPEPGPAAIDSAAELRGQTIKVAFVSSRINDQAISLLKGLLERQGATVRLFPSASINALFSSLGQTMPDLTLIYWSPYYPNLPNYLTALLSASRPVPNFTGFSDPRLDKLASALQTADPAEIPKIASEIREILDETMPWVVLYHETPMVLAHRRVRNYGITPVSSMLLREVELVRD